MSQTQTSNLCIYTRHANGVHEYVLANGSREVYDEFLAHLDRVFRDSPTDEGLRSLTSTTASRRFSMRSSARKGC